jgi:hypothetical protein
MQGPRVCKPAATPAGRPPVQPTPRASHDDEQVVTPEARVDVARVARDDGRRRTEVRR